MKLPGAAAGICALALAGNLRAQEWAVALRVEPQTVVATIPEDFLGFGYEWSAAARPGVLRAIGKATERRIQVTSSGVIEQKAADLKTFATQVQEFEQRAGKLPDAW